MITDWSKVVGVHVRPNGSFYEASFSETFERPESGSDPAVAVERLLRRAIGEAEATVAQSLNQIAAYSSALDDKWKEDPLRIPPRLRRSVADGITKIAQMACRNGEKHERTWPKLDALPLLESWKMIGEHYVDDILTNAVVERGTIFVDAETDKNK